MGDNAIQHIVDGVFLWQGKILLFLEKISRGQGNYWFPPGGKVEDGEDRLAALHRELREELGLSTDILRRYKIKFRPYCTHRGIWFGCPQHITHFLAEVNEPPPFKRCVGQSEWGWFSVSPAGGLISETLETLFICLRLGGYLLP